MKNKDLRAQPHAAGMLSASKDVMIVTEKPPEYEPDGGPLDDDQLRTVRETAAERLPQGSTISKASLFE